MSREDHGEKKQMAFKGACPAASQPSVFVYRETLLTIKKLQRKAFSFSMKKSISTKRNRYLYNVK